MCSKLVQKIMGNIIKIIEKMKEMNLKMKKVMDILRDYIGRIDYKIKYYCLFEKY